MKVGHGASTAERRPVRRRAAVVVPIVMSGVGLVATGTAGAVSVHAASGSVQGAVTAVDASAHTFTVKTSSGARLTVKVTAATAYKDSRVHAPTFADVKVGDSVAVIGSTAKGVVTAAIVIIGGSAASTSPGRTGGPGFGGPGGLRPSVFGTVTSVSTARHTFVVKTSTGSVKVAVSSSTTYRDRQTTKATFADVKVGTDVAVVGTKANGVEKASSVVLGLGRFGGPGRGRPSVFGTVTSVSTARHTFVVKTSTGSVKVAVSSSTTYRDRGTTKATFADVKVGTEVAVVGTKAKGVEKATSVLIGFGAPVGA